MYDVMTIGDIKLDDFVVLPKESPQCSLKKKEGLLCIEYGEKIPVHDFASQIAGSSPNVAVGLSRMNYNTAIYSIMGDDDVSDRAFVKLGKEGVDTRFIKIKKGIRSSSSIVLNYLGQRTILASHRPLKYSLPPINHPKWIFVGEIGAGYETLYSRLTKKLTLNKNIKFAINPGAIQVNQKKKVLYDLLEKTEVLFVNLEEATIISKSKEANLNQVIAKLWKMGPNIVVVTDGAYGAYAFAGEEIIHCPAFPAKVIEATGAGDSFATGFIGATLAGKDIMEALRWGAVNSSSVIGQVGPQPGLLSKNKIIKTLRANSQFKAHEIKLCKPKCRKK